MKKLLQLGSAVLISLSSLLTIALPVAHAATLNCTWTDGGGDNLFSNASNWSSCGGVAPGTNGGDVYNLVFPGSAAGLSPVLDFSGLTVGSITFTGAGGYDIVSDNVGHSVLTVTGGISDNSTGPFNEIDLSLTTSGSQTFSAGANSQLFLGDGSEHITTGSDQLTLANIVIAGPIIGTGSLIVNDPNYPADIDGVDLQTASLGFSGTVAINGGALFVDDPDSLSTASQVTVASGALLKGDGGVSNLTVQSGGTVAPGNSPGCLSVTSLTLNGNYQAELGGTIACTDYDQLQVSNTVNVSNGTLQVAFVNGFTPSLGQSFTIIDNGGNNAVTGTFDGLAEGATFTSNGVLFQISYTGGDGNDVVLTVVNAPAAGSNASAPGTPDTGLAAAVAHPGSVLAAASLAALTIMILARRLRTVK